MDEVLRTVASHWDGRAASFDDEVDHGLSDPVAERAWTERLTAWLPEPPAAVADLGCGTGSLAVLLARRGYTVVASDLSGEMVSRARAKAASAGVTIEVAVADAGDPGLPAASQDVVLVRHVAWTLPDPEAALDRWLELLRPGGRLVMVEGRWGTPDQEPDPDADHGDYTEVGHDLPWYGGVAASTLVPLLRDRGLAVAHHDLAGEPALWGREVSDERYVVVARLPG